MKRMKKIMAVLLAAIMTMAMAVTALAADVGTNKLTVNVKPGAGVPTQTLEGQTIYLYKLFDVTESKDGETTNYAYTVNTADGYKVALVDALAKAGKTVKINSKDEEFAAAVLDLGKAEGAVQKFANDFTTYALTQNPKLDETKNSGKLGKVTSYEFPDLDAGYYLVYVTGGKEIQSSLVTVDSETSTVNLKTEAPSITKAADKATVSIGQVVKYTVTGSIPDTTGYADYVYKIHDELSKGLDFVNDANGTALETGATTVKVTVAFKDATDASAAPTDATLDSTNNKKMSLDLSAWVKANQGNKGKEFTVTYYAKVNKDAVVTNNNKASLEYGNNPDNTTNTTPSEVKTPTYPLDILKVKKDSDPKVILADAHFTLYASTTEGNIDENNPIKVTKDAEGKYSYAADQNAADATDDMVTVASKIDGQEYNLHINGLAAGTYYLKETKAPEGYNKLTAPIEIKITKSTDADVNNWTISKDGTAENDKIIDIENSTGSLLPSTGGMGTIIFAVIAAILVLGVAVSFIRDKRKNA